MTQQTILSAVLLSGLLVMGTAKGQQSLFDSLAADRINKNKSNMTVLAAWAGVNMIQGSISATNALYWCSIWYNMEITAEMANYLIGNWENYNLLPLLMELH